MNLCPEAATALAGQIPVHVEDIAAADVSPYLLGQIVMLSVTASYIFLDPDIAGDLDLVEMQKQFLQGVHAAMGAGTGIDEDSLDG